MTSPLTSNSSSLSAFLFDPPLVDQLPTNLAQEVQVTVHELLEKNSFSPIHSDPSLSFKGPFSLTLKFDQTLLVFDIQETDPPHKNFTVALSLTPFRPHIKTYKQVLSTHLLQKGAAPASKLEAFDMARRSVHNEASELLIERLAGKITLDFETARRLFTLIFFLVQRRSFSSEGFFL